jgi:hypothetical protein
MRLCCSIYRTTLSGSLGLTERNPLDFLGSPDLLAESIAYLSSNLQS